MTEQWDQMVYQGVDVKPVVRKIAYEVHDAYGRSKVGGLERVLGRTTWPDHDTRECLDFVGDHDFQEWCRAYLMTNYARLGMRFMINQRKAWRDYDKRVTVSRTGATVFVAAHTWAAPYGRQSNGYVIGSDNPHTDHVHAQFYDRAYVAPAVVSASQAAPRLGPYRVKSNGTNARSGPGTTYSVLAVRAAGFQVRVTAVRKVGTWWWLQGSGGAWYRQDVMVIVP